MPAARPLWAHALVWGLALVCISLVTRCVPFSFKHTIEFHYGIEERPPPCDGAEAC